VIQVRTLREQSEITRSQCFLELWNFREKRETGGNDQTRPPRGKSKKNATQFFLSVYAHTCTCRWFFTSTLNKITQKIGWKHRTPSEKEKKWNVKSVPMYTFFTSTLKEIVSRCYRQFFRYRYFAGIRFAGFLVFRSVSIPPFFVYSPPFLPPFFQKGVELLKKGAIVPLLRKKGGTAPFLIHKCTDRIFLRYRFGKYREIPTEYRPKIPNRYTTL